jgi:hypothetical protein
MSQRNKAEIEQLLEAYGKRGEQTQGAFCEQHNVSLSTLDYYRRRNAKAGKAPVRLRRVKVEPEETAALFALRLANGRRIECGERALAQLIRIAEAM